MRLERFWSDMAFGGFIICFVMLCVGLYHIPSVFGIITSFASFIIGWTIFSIALSRDWL